MYFSQQHEPSAIYICYIQENKDITKVDTFKTWQLTPKQSRWMNSTTGKRQTV